VNSIKALAGLVTAIMVIAGVAIAWDDHTEELETEQTTNKEQESVLEQLVEIHAAQAAAAAAKEERIRAKQELRREYCASGALSVEDCVSLGIRPGGQR
jgi:hypothetical protein